MYSKHAFSTLQGQKGLGQFEKTESRKIHFYVKPRVKEIRAVEVCGPAFLLAVLFEKFFEERRSGYDERTESRSIKVLFPFRGRDPARSARQNQGDSQEQRDLD